MAQPPKSNRVLLCAAIVVCIVGFWALITGIIGAAVSCFVAVIVLLLLANTHLTD